MYLAEKIVHEYLPIDATIDQTAKTFLHDSLPPHLEKVEQIFSIHGNGERWNAKKQRVDCLTEISPDTNVKFLRKDSVRYIRAIIRFLFMKYKLENCPSTRLVMEENTCRLYYNLENSRIYQEKEPQYLEVDEDVGSTLVGFNV
jgi:lysine-specific demethylase/histidyl-hydroxylase NO66